MTEAILGTDVKARPHKHDHAEGKWALALLQSRNHDLAGVQYERGGSSDRKPVSIYHFEVLRFISRNQPLLLSHYSIPSLRASSPSAFGNTQDSNARKLRLCPPATSHHESSVSIVAHV